MRKESQEAFLLRNSGDRDGRFSLSVPRPFAVMPTDGSLGAGQAMQIVFSFEPELTGSYDEVLTITYDSGECCFSRLSGSAADMDVALEKSHLLLDPCYISLISQAFRVPKGPGRRGEKGDGTCKTCGG